MTFGSLQIFAYVICKHLSESHFEDVSESKMTFQSKFQFKPIDEMDPWAAYI